jgi:hypothetical protein
VLAAVIAAVLMFAVISEIMSPGDAQEKRKETSGGNSQPGLDGGASLVGDAGIELKTGVGDGGRTYGEYKGRPKKQEKDNLSTWERFKVEEEKRKEESLRRNEPSGLERESMEGED